MTVLPSILIEDHCIQVVSQPKHIGVTFPTETFTGEVMKTLLPKGPSEQACCGGWVVLSLSTLQRRSTRALYGQYSSSPWLFGTARYGTETLWIWNACRLQLLGHSFVQNGPCRSRNCWINMQLLALRWRSEIMAFFHYLILTQPPSLCQCCYPFTHKRYSLPLQIPSSNFS